MKIVFLARASDTLGVLEKGDKPPYEVSEMLWVVASQLACHMTMRVAQNVVG